MKFTEEKLEQAFIDLLNQEDIPHVNGNSIARDTDEVLIENDLKKFLRSRYGSNNITENEIEQIVRRLKTYPASDLYESNKLIMSLISEGFILKREDPAEKDIFVQLTQELEKRFMYLVKRLKAAHDICVGSDELSQYERDKIHFYIAVRSIVFKLTKGNAPDKNRNE